ATLDVDAYNIRFENDYSSTPDPVSGEPVYFLNGEAVTKGVEAESTILVARGLNLYLNGTIGSARYTDTDLWVQNAPKDTETIGVNYSIDAWNVGFFNKRVGSMYNDNGSAHSAVAIDPFNINKLFGTYTLRGSRPFAQSRIRLAVNNLFDSHTITGVSPASTRSNLPAPGDV